MCSDMQSDKEAATVKRKPWRTEEEQKEEEYDMVTTTCAG